MRLIPGKTKVKIELFRGITIGDMIVGAIVLAMVTLVLLSTLPARGYIAGAVAIVGGWLVFRLDGVSNYMTLLHFLKYMAYPRHYRRVFSDKHLASKNTEKKPGEKWDEWFDDKIEPSEELSVRERIDRIKEKKESKKEEERLLNSSEAGDDEKNAVWRARAEKESAKAKVKAETKESLKKETGVESIMPFTGISEGFIEYNGKYYATVIEVDPIEFRFFSQFRRDSAIEACLGKVLRSLREDYAANIVKIDRPVIYDEYLAKEYDKLNELRASYEKGLLTEEELQSRVEIQYDRINAMRHICYEEKVVQPFYYIVLFNIDKRQLLIDTNAALASLAQGEMVVRRLSEDKELAVFLKYTNTLDFEEKDIDSIAPEDYVTWAMPESVSFTTRSARVDGVYTHLMRVINYPAEVGDSWIAGVMSIPGTKVVVKISPMDRTKAIRSIDRSLSELRAQWASTGIDSKKLEIEAHVNTLSMLLATLQQDNEVLLTVNIYITMYDAVRTAETGNSERVQNSSLPVIGDMKKLVRRSWQEIGMRLNPMDCAQLQCFIGGQVSAYDPFLKDGRGMPSNTIAAMFPWIYARVSDPGGIRLGTNDGVPVFIDFFRRDSERINSNMVIIGKSGSGKSYGTKSILTNMASEDSKIFILDPENEYTELAHTLHGKVINVGNAQYGRLNPFHIITSLEDDEAGENSVGGSFAAHLQFLEEFFRQILPDIDKEALEYLNSLVERMYMNAGITPETDLSKLTSRDYPVFDDLYDVVLEEFERTSNEYLRTMLQTLMNYVSKFATGGRNANIWNGPSTITTDENFSVFNFQSLLANRNTTIANAQMLLVLKYVDNEIIKNRDYNRKYGLKRKVVVVIDEAHVFIDTKFPVALDFMFQLAKRIRKYNGMQIVITQNIKDFVGSEEIARKSTAIINACQYSFIFGLAPNDMDDLCKLYEKAGGINEVEQDQILTAPRGMAFTIMSPTSRSSFMVEVPQSMVNMFEQPDYVSQYFVGEQGAQYWEDFIGTSREQHDISVAERKLSEPEQLYVSDDYEDIGSGLTFSEISADEYGSGNSGGITFDEIPAQPEEGHEGITFEEEIPLPAPRRTVDKYSDPPVQHEAPSMQEFMTQFMQYIRNPEQQPVQQPAQQSEQQPVQQAAEVDMDAILAAVRAEVEKEVSERIQSASYGQQEDEYGEGYGYSGEDEYDDSYEGEDYDDEYEDDEEFYDDEYDDEYEYDEDEDTLGGYDEAPEADSDESESDESDASGVKFDIMALLDEQLDSYSEMDLLERMQEIEVETMEITLDDLAAYIKGSRKKRGT